MTTEFFMDEPEPGSLFSHQPFRIYRDVIAAPLLERLMAQAAAATFRDQDVPQVGTHAVEAVERVGIACQLLLERLDLRAWLSAATGIAPLHSLAGRLAETRANGRDELGWHDDLIDPARRIAVVINLSDADYAGGLFELRRKGENRPLLSWRHDRPGTIMIFQVCASLEHRVTPLASGGPRRVYAGWYIGDSPAAIASS